MSAVPGLRVGFAAPELVARAAPVAASGAIGILLGASVLAGGGARSGAIVWIGIGSLGVVCALCALALAGALPLPRFSRLGLVSIAALTLFVLWSGLSVAWSLAPDLSWGYFNRGLAYLGLVGVGLFFTVFVRRAPLVFASILTVAIAAAAVWALAGKIDPSLFEDGLRRARLREPVGFWNPLALLFAFGVPLSLWASARRHAALVRALGVGLLFLLVPATLLTVSRSGILAALLAAAAWLLLAPGRLELVAALALAVPAGAAVGQWALGQPGLVDDFQELSVRASDGRAFGWTVGLAFIAVVVIAYVLARVEARRPLTDAVRERVLRVVGWLALGLIVVGVVLFVVRVGNPATWVGDKVDEFTSPELVSNDPARLTSVNANKRLDWWAEAASAFRDEPALGSGAGTFPVVHRLYRADEISVASPHNVLMQFLAETGLVGALLAAVAAAAGVVAAGRAARRLADDQQLAGLALVIILVLYALHALVDVEWDFLAVTAPALLALGVMLGKARALWLERFPILALVPPLVFLPIVVSLLLPPLAASTSRASTEELFDDPARALALAGQAHALDPASLEPIFARADAELVLGRPTLARAAYLQAIELQPRNPRSWLQLTEFELAEGDLEVARASWLRLSVLDPHDCRVRELGMTLGLDATPCGPSP